MEGQPLELFVDGLAFAIGPFAARLDLSRSLIGGKLGDFNAVAHVHMSPEFAKVMVIMLSREVKKYERDNACQINVPIKVLENLKIAPDDWNTHNLPGE